MSTHRMSAHTHTHTHMDLLGIGFLQEGAPELIFSWRTKVDQFVVQSGQQVIYPHLLPLPIHPELWGRERERE